MDKLTFFYELIENIKHVSSFELIFKLLGKRLDENFDIKSMAFFYYSNTKKSFYLGNSFNFTIEKEEYSINESEILNSVVNEGKIYECIDCSGDDLFIENICRLNNKKFRLHPLVLKDKISGIFVFENSEKADNNFISAVMDMISIAFQRIVLSGHTINSEEKGEHFREHYFKEMLQNKLMSCIELNDILGFGLISVAYYDSQYQGHRTTFNREVFAKIYEEILNVTSTKDIVLKYGSDRFIIMAAGKKTSEMKKLLSNIKKVTENHIFIEKTNFRGSVKVSYGCASYPENAATMKDLYDNTITMLHENIKIEGWLKSL